MAVVFNAASIDDMGFDLEKVERRDMKCEAVEITSC
jgi:hypothetical protein